MLEEQWLEHSEKGGQREEVRAMCVCEGGLGRALWTMERTWAFTLREVGSLGGFKG